MGSLTFHQEIVIVVLGMIGAILSITGSMMIMLHLYYRSSSSNNRRIKKQQRRLSNTRSSRSSNNNNYNNDNNPTTSAATQQSTIGGSTFFYIQRRIGVRNTNTNNNTKNTMLGTTDRRILFWMSFFDIIQSAILALQPILLDRDDSYFIFGFGTYTTCQVAGTIHQLSIAGPLYACMLNFFYLLTVRYGWSQRRFDQSKIEWFMHVFAIGWPLITAITGAIMGFWGNRPFFMGCWVGEYPHGCESSNGTIPCRETLFVGLTGVFMLAFYLCTVLTSNTLLFLHVRKISKKSLYWGFRNQQQQQNLLTMAQTTTITTTTPCGENADESQQLCTSTAAADPSSGILRGSSSSSSGVFPGNFTSSRLSLSELRRTILNRGRSSSSETSMRKNQQNAINVPSFSTIIIEDDRNRVGTSSITNNNINNTNSSCSTDIEEIHRKHLRRVGMQGVYYVLAGAVLYTPFLITQLFLNQSKVTTSQVYVLLLIQAFVYPLDGLANAIIYFRPRFLDIRYNQRTGTIRKSILETLLVCVFGETQSSRRRRNKQQPRLQQQQQRNASVVLDAILTTSQQQQQHQQQQKEIVDTEENKDSTSNDLSGTTIKNDDGNESIVMTTIDFNESYSLDKILDTISEETGNNQTTTHDDEGLLPSVLISQLKGCSDEASASEIARNRFDNIKSSSYDIIVDEPGDNNNTDNNYNIVDDDDDNDCNNDDIDEGEIIVFDYTHYQNVEQQQVRDKYDTLDKY